MKLNIERRGKGRPLVFFHGWGFDHRVWLPLATALETQYSLYLVDLPGFGLSSPMSWSDFKDRLLQQLPKQFVIIGWSMGGLFATKLAIEASEHIMHLINVASSPRFIKNENWPGIEKRVFSTFFKNLATNPQQTISEFIHLQLRTSRLHCSKYQKNNYHPIEFQPQPEHLKTGLEILATWDLRHALHDFHKPASYLFGRLDAITPVATMDTMQQLYPAFNYVMLAKAAHMPFLSHQHEFIKCLEQLLA
ncbi:biotin operon repressor and biotin [Legionella lansingensis]|uniref:Pimeloyl-[acyl-carrier protein] methyl ester esterase n=1 Tax=Legionella lansingensis TaxID=45067 RepID=A0A0W0VTI2_9GAMM|nr:alpha/beta fold hydrolase [Legionella lansingensis]KTD23436.1 biotin biosynthesis protein BioH [Legionella lansingensis]SNV50911.1 biotin operon repressor and biotin [Legionella lansingensis]